MSLICGCHSLQLHKIFFSLTQRVSQQNENCLFCFSFANKFGITTWFARKFWSLPKLEQFYQTFLRLWFTFMSYWTKWKMDDLCQTRSNIRRSESYEIGYLRLIKLNIIYFGWIKNYEFCGILRVCFFRYNKAFCWHEKFVGWE